MIVSAFPVSDDCLGLGSEGRVLVWLALQWEVQTPELASFFWWKNRGAVYLLGPLSNSLIFKDLYVFKMLNCKNMIYKKRSQIGDNDFTANLTGLPAGLYVYRIQNGQMTQYVKTIKN